MRIPLPALLPVLLSVALAIYTAAEALANVGKDASDSTLSFRDIFQTVWPVIAVLSGGFFAQLWTRNGAGQLDVALASPETHQVKIDASETTTISETALIFSVGRRHSYTAEKLSEMISSMRQSMIDEEAPLGFNYVAEGYERLKDSNASASPGSAIIGITGFTFDTELAVANSGVKPLVIMSPEGARSSIAANGYQVDFDIAVAEPVKALTLAAGEVRLLPLKLRLTAHCLPTGSNAVKEEKSGDFDPIMHLWAANKFATELSDGMKIPLLLKFDRFGTEVKFMRQTAKLRTSEHRIELVFSCIEGRITDLTTQMRDFEVEATARVERLLARNARVEKKET